METNEEGGGDSERSACAADTLAIQTHGGGQTETGHLLARLESAEALLSSAVAARRRLQKVHRASRAAGSAHQSALTALKAAQTRDAELRSGRGSQLCKVVGVTVYEFWLELPGYSGPVRDATARVEQHGDVHQVSDVTGKTKGGVGGAVVGGLLLGPVGAVVGLAATRKNTVKTTVKTVDTRQFEIEVRGPGFAWSTTRGPSAAADLRELRDTINARGSSAEDIRDLIDSHTRFLADESERATHLGSEVESANGAVVVQKQALGSAVNEYAAVRLPFVLYLKARWARSGPAGRVLAVVLSPIVLTALFVRHCVDRVSFRK